jgi:hypothetical protein
MIGFGHLIEDLMLDPELVATRGPIRRQHFEITDRPHYHLCLRHQPTMNLSLNISEDLTTDLVNFTHNPN